MTINEIYADVQSKAPKIYKIFRENYLQMQQKEVAYEVGLTPAAVNGSETLGTNSRNNAKILFYYVMNGLNAEKIFAISNLIDMLENKGRLGNGET